MNAQSPCTIAMETQPAMISKDRSTVRVIPDFVGNGSSCANLNECLTGFHDCHGNATCADFHGTFTCSCNSGFQEMEEIAPILMNVHC